MALFTALHRELGLPASDPTAEMLDQAITAGVAECDDLDWKTKLPPPGQFAGSDIVKDMAAMANSGGGLIVFGVDEQQRVATGRVDAGQDLTETYERTVRAAAYSRISPPLRGIQLFALGQPQQRAVALYVPASPEAPHLITKDTGFLGYPVRNHADTHWLSESQIAAAYRRRFEWTDNAAAALQQLYSDAVGTVDITERAWLVAAARPANAARLDHTMTSSEASYLITEAATLSRTLLNTKDQALAGRGPLAWVSHPPRPGLRRWHFLNYKTSLEGQEWRGASISLHHNGSVTLTAAMGGTPTGRDEGEPVSCVRASRAEVAIADFLATLSRLTTTATRYDIIVGIEWDGPDPIVMTAIDTLGYPYDGTSTPLRRYHPVTMTLDIGDPATLAGAAVDLATDVINQGGIASLSAIRATN